MNIFKITLSAIIIFMAVIAFMPGCSSNSDLHCLLEEADCPDFKIDTTPCESCQECISLVTSKMSNWDFHSFLEVDAICSQSFMICRDTESKLEISFIRGQALFYICAWIMQNNYTCWKEYLDKLEHVSSSMNSLDKDAFSSLMVNAMYNIVINDYDKAADSITRSGLIHGKDNYLYFYMKWLAFHNEENPIQFLDRAIELNDKYIPALLERASEYADDSDFDKAYNFLGELMKIAPNSSDVLYNLGIYYFHIKEYGLSLSYLEKALENEPYYRLAECAINLIKENNLN